MSLMAEVGFAVDDVVYLCSGRDRRSIRMMAVEVARVGRQAARLR